MFGALMSLLPGSLLVGLVWLVVAIRRGWPAMALTGVLVVWAAVVTAVLALLDFWFWALPLLPLCGLMGAGGILIRLGHRTGWWLVAYAPVLYIPIYVGSYYLMTGRVW
jgi:hypothetical protein